VRKLDGKVAIVTGAARGIGLEYAFRLAELGANIAICDINLKSSQKYEYEKMRVTKGDVVEEITSRGVEAYGEEVDVTDPERVSKFIQNVYEKWEHIDILVNNAGGGLGSPTSSQASELDFDIHNQVMGRNYLSTLYMTQMVVPYMKKQRSGKIVNVSSIFALTALKYQVDYSISKVAVAHYTKCLAQDLGSYGITVNAIAPGHTATGQFQSRFEEEISTIEDSYPMGRLVTPEDCAKVVEFLTTDLSDFVTGQIIVVDGGYTKV